jgi:hypothetical protein
MPPFDNFLSISAEINEICGDTRLLEAQTFFELDDWRLVESELSLFF